MKNNFFKNNQSGFIIPAVIIAVVVAGGVAYYFSKNSDKSNSNQSLNSNKQSTTTESVSSDTQSIQDIAKNVIAGDRGAKAFSDIQNIANKYYSKAALDKFSKQISTTPDTIKEQVVEISKQMPDITKGTFTTDIKGDYATTTVKLPDTTENSNDGGKITRMGNIVEFYFVKENNLWKLITFALRSDGSYTK